MLRVGLGETGVAVVVPLHGSAHTVTVLEEIIVAHADFVAVIHHRRARQRKQQHVHQFYLAAVVVHERGQPVPDAEVYLGLRVFGIHLIHVVAFLVGHHFQRQFVVVAQKHRPLARVRDGRCLLNDVHDRVAVFHFHRHVHPRHDREVVVHVAFVAVAKVACRVFGPHIGFGQKHPARIILVHVGAHFLEEGVRFGQVLAVGAVAFKQIGHGIHPETIHAHVHPVVENLENLFLHLRTVVVQVGLVVEKPVPVVGFRHRIPSPVGGFGVGENNPHVLVFLVRVAPHVIITIDRTLRCPSGPLKPRVLVGGVVEHQFGNHAQAPAFGFLHEILEILDVAVRRVDGIVVGNVVAIIAQRRRIKWQQPDCRHAQFFEVVQFLDQALEVADAIAIAVGKSLDVQFINDCVLVPAQVVVLGKCVRCHCIGEVNNRVWVF